MEQFCYTRTETKTFTYKWVIRNFTSRHERPGEFIRSSVFCSADIDKNLNWFLQLFPNSNSSSYGYQFLSIYLVKQELMTGKTEAVTVKIDCCLQNNKGEKVYSNTQVMATSATNLGWDQILFWIKKDLLGDLLSNDELTIFCTLSTRKGVQYSENMEFKIPEGRISEDFGQLLINEDLSDVVLSVKGRDFKAHKAILAARSPVFAAMFKHDMQETKSNRVNISDIDPEVFNELLQFIYTEKCSNVDTFPDKLLEVSDKYGLDRLKAMCEEALSKSLTVENAADILTLADLHGSQQLKSVTVTFIIPHYQAVKQTKGWTSIMKKPTLLQTVIDRALPTTSNQAVASS